MASTTRLHPDEINLLTRTVFETGYKSYKPTGKEIFNTIVPERLDEKETIAAIEIDMPEMAEGEVFKRSASREIGNMSYTSKAFGQGVAITKLMQEFSNFKTAMKGMNRLGYVARYKQDKFMADVLTGAFADTVTYDGEYLISGSHLINDDPAKTQSNLLSGALSATTLNAGYILFNQMVDHGDVPMPQQETTLVIPRALAMTAWQILNSPNSPEDDNNNRNFLNTLNIKIVIWDLLDKVSSTAWFLTTSKAFHSLNAYQKTQPTLVMNTDYQNSDLVQTCRFVQTQGSPDYLGIGGSLGT